MITHIEKSLNSFYRVAMATIESGKAAGVLLAMLVLAGSAIAPACQRSQRSRNVVFVHRPSVFPEGEPVERRMLVIGIDGDGKLSLNKFEIGTVAETNVLAEKLQVVFAERQRAGLNEREVIIEMKGAVRSEDVRRVLEMLGDVNADPIRILRHEH